MRNWTRNGLPTREPASVLDLVLRLAEDGAEQALLFAQLFQGTPVMRFQITAIQLHQDIPAKAFGNRRRFIERRSRLLIRHSQEQQKRELFNVIAARQTVIAEQKGASEPTLQ